MRPWRCGVVIAALVLASCMPASPPDTGLGRIPVWFRYLAGDDIAASCVSGGGDRYRAVYNGSWSEQVRAYDIVATARGAVVDTRVWGPGTLVTLAPDGIWIAARRGRRSIGAAELTALREALTAAGVLAMPERAIRARSDQFYWAIAACRNGRFTATIRVLDGPAAQPAFATALFAVDGTDVPVNPPRPVGGALIESGQDGREAGRFVIQAGPDGFAVPRF